MKLKALIENHDAHSKGPGFKNNLGDGYLLKMNPIYKSIRDEAESSGFRFETGRFFDYETLPLTQLPKILARKIIPYHDNVKPLREIEKQAPGVFSLSEIPPLQPNRLFHESAHAVAHSVLTKLFPKQVKGMSGERQLALLIFLEESFANTCESIANIHSTSEVHDEFLYKNSYIMEEEAERRILRKAVDALGVQPVFETLLLSFLHANFLRTQEVNDAFPRVLDLVLDQPRAKSRLLKSVFKTGLTLDPEFTVFTNSFCLRLRGIKAAPAKLFAYDFLAELKKEPLQSAVKKLSAMVG